MQEDFNLEDKGRGMMSVIVRIAGLFLLIVGLMVGLLTIREALQLYNDPARIERFAVAIEKGSNIDTSLNSLRDSTIAAAVEEDAPPSAAAKNTPESVHNNNVRVSYFLSWVIVLLLLLLLARIALAAIKTGGELVLYDMQIKQFARMLVRESGNGGKR